MNSPMDKIYWTRHHVPQRPCSADLELFVAEVTCSGNFKEASEGDDVARPS
jgi:hypothetical protein